MVAFLKTTVGYEWLAEMESQYGPKTYESPDGEYREEIVIAYQRDRAVYVGGIPNNQTWLSYRGDDSRLILPYSRMTLGDFAPILSEWKAKAPLQ